MSRARELFDRLRHGGTDALVALIDDREPESFFLDFKRSEDDGQGNKLGRSDNKNLSKAISGFANASGGVLVWGVDCRRDPASGNEVAIPHRLVDAKGFETRLQSAVSRSTIPAFGGVEFVSFPEAEGSLAGFVAMLVPQSSIGPVRAQVGEQYYIRSGSDFVPVPHDVLAGMFGRAPQPRIDINLSQYQSMLVAQSDRLTVVFGIVAVNLGSVLGERPYVSLAWEGGDEYAVQLQSPDEAHIKVRRGLLPCASVLTQEDFVLPPNAGEELCKLFCRFSASQPAAFALEVVLGVRGAPPLRVTLAARPEEIAAFVESARRSGAPVMGTPIKILA